MAERDYAAIAERYARDVVAKTIPAGKYVRLACQRHLKDLGRQRRKAFAYRFDAEKAARACRFIELMPHAKGKWAAKKELIRLEPWQVFITACTFGWLRKKDGLRRFRVVFLVVPRKNGKSAWVAPVGLYMLAADGEFGAEVYSGATNEKQAWEVFRPARLMAQRTPAFLRKFGVEVNAKTINIVGNESRFETLIGNPGDGQSPSCSIHDEYHEHPDDDQVDTMQTGMGAREQPLLVLITTAGDNLAGPCYARIQDSRKVLEGIRQDDELFYVEYAADEDDDWKSELALRKANPNFDISVGGDYLRARQRDAIATPRKAGVFKTKHLNLWVSARSAYHDIEAWRRCADPSLPKRAVDVLALDWLQGRRCRIGLDLASKIDIAAMEYLFEPLNGLPTRDDPYISVSRYFLPSDTVEATPAYRGWDAEGLLDVSEGEVIDFDEIEAALLDASSRFQLEGVPYDPHQATQLSTRMLKAGLPMEEYRQIVLNMSEPMKQAEALSRARKIRHNGCPVMEWQWSNVVATPDKKDNVYPNKPDGQAHLKIDNAVAKYMAIGHSMAAADDSSVYESRGLRVL